LGLGKELIKLFVEIINNFLALEFCILGLLCQNVDV
jgi:hypothetical protein